MDSKLRLSKGIYLIFCLLLIFSCKIKDCKEIKENVFTLDVRYDQYETIYRIGKRGIPCLIELIDQNKKTFVGYKDPSSSIIEPFIFKNYSGIISAYVLELFIEKDTIVTKESIITYDNNPYRIYEFCVIVRKEDKEYGYKPLNYEDIKKIKTYYEVWWDKNKDKTLEEIRSDWKDEKNRPLYNTEYIWI